MVIQEVYEKFKHLDQLLSDKEWLGLTNNLLYAILYDLWQAVKEAAENNSDGQDVREGLSNGHM